MVCYWSRVPDISGDPAKARSVGERAPGPEEIDCVLIGTGSAVPQKREMQRLRNRIRVSRLRVRANEFGVTRVRALTTEAAALLIVVYRASNGGRWESSVYLDLVSGLSCSFGGRGAGSLRAACLSRFAGIRFPSQWLAPGGAR